MSEYVVAHITRQLPPTDQRYPRQTMETLTELPDPTVRGSGHVSYLTGRTLELPGFGGGNVYGHLDMAARYPSLRGAQAAARRPGRGRVVLDIDTATEWTRVRHVARVRAKARKVR